MKIMHIIMKRSTPLIPERSFHVMNKKTKSVHLRDYERVSLTSCKVKFNGVDN